MSHQLLQPRSRLRRYARQGQQLDGATDERLVAAVRQGDERAFEAVYDRYHQPLLGFCRHMLGTREEAEDALQQVFVAAHRHLREPAGPLHLKAWLYAVARNRCVSMLRARRDAVSIDVAHEPHTDDLCVAGEAERREELQELLGDLARLPDDQRAALVLAELGDLSHEEIAIALGVRKDKVKALMFQARDTLSGWRQARTASCRAIQEQLATLRGSALRRAPIRRHVALCPSCAAFEREVARQRAAMALLLPVVPSVALKASVLSAAVSAGHEVVGAAGAAAGAAGAGGLQGAAAVAGASGLTAKALAVTALVVGVGGAGTVAVRQLDPPRPLTRSAATAPARPAPTTGAPSTRGAERGPASPITSRRAAASAPREGRGATRGSSSSAPGHTKAHKTHGHAAQPEAKVGHGGGATKTKQPKQPQRAKPPKANGRPAAAPRPAPATARRPKAAKPKPIAPKAPPVKAPPVKARAVGRSTPPPAAVVPPDGKTVKPH